ncbi:hypothetical protein FNA46_00140 [Rhizobium straminoryzae]|uniref:Lytic murein transglycosylase n=1 Tax=Rhizobium straminoryzae TaxID=1387186 RepID=A0A549TIW4_9HYPH|nr:hypothetical protein FNA46_00140 [Rhizobium straminoryzae]
MCRWTFADGATPLCPAGHLPLKGGDRQNGRPLAGQRARSGFFDCDGHGAGSRRSDAASPPWGDYPRRAEGLAGEARGHGSSGQAQG